MRRVLALVLLALVAGSGAGCQIPVRIGCEAHHFWEDTQRMFFGIDYPMGMPESGREPYYGLPSRVPFTFCLD